MMSNTRLPRARSWDPATNATTRLTLFLAASVLCLTGLAACQADGSSHSDDRTLTIGLNGAPSSLNPATGFADITLQTLAYEPLILLRPDGELGPGLAVEWGYTDSRNRAFQLKLREGAKFSDGTPVDAAAVKKWLEYFAGAGGIFASRMGQITSVDTPDNQTVVLHFEAPNPTAALVLAHNWGFVASPSAVDDPDSLNTSTAGAGPYELDPAASVTGDHYTYVPNADYYDQGKIKYEKVVVKVITDPSSMLQAALAGQVDVAVGDLTTVAAAEEGGLDVVGASGGTAGFRITDTTGTLAPPLGDVRVRQALNYAIDRAAIATALAGEYGEASSQMPSVDGFDAAYQDYYEYDPQKAKALLREAGYDNGLTLPVLDVAGSQLSNGTSLTQAAAKYWSEVGIEVDVTTVPTQADQTTTLQERKSPLVNAYLPSIFSMWQWYQTEWAETTIWNSTGWTDPSLRELWRTGQSTADQATSAKAWQDMSRRATEQAYFVPVFKFDTVYYVTPSVKNVAVTDAGFAPYAPDWDPS